MMLQCALRIFAGVHPTPPPTRASAPTMCGLASPSADAVPAYDACHALGSSYMVLGIVEYAGVRAHPAKHAGKAPRPPVLASGWTPVCIAMHALMVSAVSFCSMLAHVLATLVCLAVCRFPGALLR